MDRPIIFSAAMIRALLDGRKTMTRRIPTPTWRKIVPGDRLYVRENLQPDQSGFDYAAGGDGIDLSELTDEQVEFWNRTALKRGDPMDAPIVPCIHMPRWASRLTLVVTATKIEKLQSMSEEDAKAEGIGRIWPVGYSCDTGPNHFTISIDGASYSRPTAAGTFRMLWETLHGDDAWDANPEVVALTFEVHKANIDRMKEAA